MRQSLLLLLATASFCVSARADDTADFLKPENWEGLQDIWKYDGKTITAYTGKDGIKFNTFLCSKQKFSDFELSFKIELKNGIGNSGVQIRSMIVEEQKDKFVVAGPQCDVGQQYWGSLYGEKFGGMMKASKAEMVKKVVKPKEFNDYMLRVEGKKVTIKINGETMVEGEFEKMPDEGIIAFQAHTGPEMTVTFKDIKFTNLKK